MVIQNKEIHKCIKCGRLFKYKSELDRHMTRKITCDDDERNDDHLKKKTCVYCDKVLTRADSMAKHLRSCKKKQSIEEATKSTKNTKSAKNDQNNAEILAAIMKEMQDMKKQITELKTENAVFKSSKTKSKTKSKTNNVKGTFVEGNMNSTQNNNTQNTVNNIHNDIKIIAYGKEDLSFITDDNYRLLLNKGFKSVQNLVEYIHLNQNKPENQNIYVSNMRDNYILIFDGNQWQLKERDDILQEMIENKTDILSEKFDELIKTLDESTIKKFKRFLDEKDENRIVEQIKKELKLILYNKKLIKNIPPRIGGIGGGNIGTQSKEITETKSSVESIDELSNESVNEQLKGVESSAPKTEAKTEPKIEEKDDIIINVIKTYKQRKSQSCK